MKIINILIILFMSINSSYGQCCSAGNPVGGTTNIGILDSGTVRLITFYRYSQSSGYWEGMRKSDFYFVKNADFNFGGLVLAYGLDNKLTIETELGYYFNKSQTYNVTPEFTNKGFGLSNAVVSLKQNLISKTEKPFEWTVALGVKFPFKTEYQIVDNVELPRDVQSSTSTYGIVAQSFLYKGIPSRSMKLFLSNRFESNTQDVKKFRYGNSLINSLFVTKQINNSDWTAIIQVRHEYRTKDIKNIIENNYLGFLTTGQVVNSSGGHLTFVAPQINYTVAQKWNISLLADIPIFRYYNGIQLGNKYSFAVYLSRDFGSKSCAIPQIKN